MLSIQRLRFGRKNEVGGLVFAFAPTRHMKSQPITTAELHINDSFAQSGLVRNLHDTKRFEMLARKPCHYTCNDDNGRGGVRRDNDGRDKGDAARWPHNRPGVRSRPGRIQVSAAIRACQPTAKITRPASEYSEQKPHHKA